MEMFPGCCSAWGFLILSLPKKIFSWSHCLCFLWRSCLGKSQERKQHKSSILQWKTLWFQSAVLAGSCFSRWLVHAKSCTLLWDSFSVQIRDSFLYIHTSVQMFLHWHLTGTGLSSFPLSLTMCLYSTYYSGPDWTSGSYHKLNK